MKLNDAVFGAIFVLLGAVLLVHVQKFPMIPGLKAAVAHFSHHPDWRIVRPPLTPIAPTIERELLLALEAEGFTMPNL